MSERNFLLFHFVSFFLFLIQKNEWRKGLKKWRVHAFFIRGRVSQPNPSRLEGTFTLQPKPSWHKTSYQLSLKAHNSDCGSGWGGRILGSGQDGGGSTRPRGCGLVNQSSTDLLSVSYRDYYRDFGIRALNWLLGTRSEKFNYQDWTIPTFRWMDWMQFEERTSKNREKKDFKKLGLVAVIWELSDRNGTNIYITKETKISGKWRERKKT